MSSFRDVRIVTWNAWNAWNVIALIIVAPVEDLIKHVIKMFKAQIVIRNVAVEQVCRVVVGVVHCWIGRG